MQLQQHQQQHQHQHQQATGSCLTPGKSTAGLGSGVARPGATTGSVTAGGPPLAPGSQQGSSSLLAIATCSYSLHFFPNLFTSSRSHSPPTIFPISRSPFVRCFRCICANSSRSLGVLAAFLLTVSHMLFFIESPAPLSDLFTYILYPPLYRLTFRHCMPTFCLEHSHVRNCLLPRRDAGTKACRKCLK
ncbi:unnamed protein product [Protopolystoma xenopodis]|uniref:Uncharacterized protein n=1 Tax=Protopolystoma xenopodis TaxID=117903 RepID=A0A448XRQ8_9PLAT|nr:unnamed protein product [Protopolystoma xenopodis]